MPLPFWDRGNALTSSKLAVAGSLIVFLLVLAAILAPIITTEDPYKQNLPERRTPPIWLEGGTVSHPLGTDVLGRDMWSRLVYGIRTSLLVSLVTLFVGGLIGITLGIVFACYPTPWDDVYDLEASFPVSLLLQAAWLLVCAFVALVFTATIGPSMGTLIVAVVLTTWPRYIKVVRGRAVSLMAVASVGRANKSRISDYATAVRQFLPRMTDVLPSLLISQMAFLIAVEFCVTFLGIGILPPTPSLGGMVSDGRAYLFSTGWSTSVIPLAFLGLMVAGFWMLGDGLHSRASKSGETL